MVTVRFTPNLARHVECVDATVPGDTVREALERVFTDNPRLRGYVLDDQGVLRKHMVVFLDGLAISDRQGLSDPINGESEIFVMQALSGG